VNLNFFPSVWRGGKGSVEAEKDLRGKEEDDQYLPLFSPSFPWETHYPFSIKTLSSNPHENPTH